MSKRAGRITESAEKEAPGNGASSIVEAGANAAEVDQVTEAEQPAEPVAESCDEDSPTEEAPDEEPAPVASVITEQSEMRKEGSVWRVTIIREGWSLNGRYYPASTLRESAKLWEGAPVCAYGFDPSGRSVPLDHVPPHIERQFPRGTFLNQVGFLKHVSVVTESDRIRLDADFFCTDESVGQALYKTERNGGRMPGFSIHADGETMPGIREGKRGQIVSRITKPKELTIVSEPAAGGRFERLVASIQNDREEEKMKFKKLRQFMAERLPKALQESVQKMDALSLCEAVADTLKEMDAGASMLKMAYKWLKAGKTEEAADILEMIIEEMGAEAPAEEPVEEMKDEEMEESKVDTSEQTKQLEALGLKLDSFEAEIAKRDCRELLNTQLSESHLPELAQEQIRESFADRVFDPKDLAKRIKDTKDLLAIDAGGEALIESGHNVPARFGGDPQVSVLYEGVDKLSMAADLLFNYDYEHEFREGNITESQRSVYKSLNSPRTYSPLSLYHAATGDYGHTNQIQRGSILESATTSNFANILGTSMTKAIAIIFKTQQAPDWSDLIVQKDLPRLKQQDRHVVGSFSQLPDVAEAGAYTDLGVPMELPTSYSLGKKGGFFRFTEEMVLADDMSFFQNIIPALIRAGVHSRDLLAYSFITGKNNTLTSYDGLVHYHANHHNVGSASLAHAAAEAAENSIRNTLAPAFRTTLGAAQASTTATTFTFASTEGMQIGDYIRINAEFVQVTSVTNSTTAECARGALNSTGATHSNADPAWVMGGGLTQSDLDLTMIVPTELKNTARVIAGSELLPGGTNNDINTLKGAFKVLPVNKIYLDGSSVNWYLMASHRVFPAIEFGYYDGRRSPEVVTQDNPAVGQVFSNDQLTYRAKFRIGGKAIFHEGRYASRQ